MDNQISAVNMSPWCQANKSPFTFFLDDKWSTRITRTDLGFFCISTYNGIINDLTKIYVFTCFNTDIFQISPFQITRDLGDWAIQNIQFILSVSASLERVSFIRPRLWWVDQRDWFSVLVQVEWSFDLSNSEIIDNFGTIICWMADENIGLNLLTRLDRTAAKVTSSLKR